jgi:hypothetical protein
VSLVGPDGRPVASDADLFLVIRVDEMGALSITARDPIAHLVAAGALAESVEKIANVPPALRRGAKHFRKELERAMAALRRPAPPTVPA